MDLRKHAGLRSFAGRVVGGVARRIAHPTRSIGEAVGRAFSGGSSAWNRVRSSARRTAAEFRRGLESSSGAGAARRSQNVAASNAYKKHVAEQEAAEEAKKSLTRKIKHVAIGATGAAALGGAYALGRKAKKKSDAEEASYY